MLDRGDVLPHVGKLAVLRANAIGDLIFTMPALHALRAAYPRAEIVLPGQAWHHAFLADRPGPVARVIDGRRHHPRARCNVQRRPPHPTHPRRRAPIEQDGERLDRTRRMRDEG